MYVREICAEGFFVTFPWWLKNVKSRSKIALFFQMSAILKFDFQKRKQLRFCKVNYLNYTKKKKKKNLHVATTFSLKQGETRTSHEPIPHPLMVIKIGNLDPSFCQIFQTQVENPLPVLVLADDSMRGNISKC